MNKEAKCPKCGKITEYDTEKDRIGEKDVLGKIPVKCPECNETVHISLTESGFPSRW